MRNCPECGAKLINDGTCQDLFYQMLFWEAENPELGEVHHLMVLAYHLQHPGLYSPDGLAEGIRLLDLFLVQGMTPEAVRKQNRERVDSSKRKWKIKSSGSLRGSYEQPVDWSMTAADVVVGGAENYCANVRLWVESILTTLKKARIAPL